MSSLPAGRVTFVFTDIEGSTRLFQRVGDEYRALLDHHRQLLREAFQANEGVELGTEGDSFFVVFSNARAALDACLEGQIALKGWPGGRDLRVRMGLHSGEVHPVGNDYVSLVVHQAARVAASAHGGQILVSETTREACREDLPDGSELRHIGDYRLKDFDDAQSLFQLVHPRLDAEFPALRALPAAAHNLPEPRTTFVGRVAELEELRGALDANRLVTVTGPGGVGKTRLVIQAARLSAPTHPDGVRFVDLQQADSAESVAPHFANALGVREEMERDLADTIGRALGESSMLLVVDNCEHVLAESARVVDRIVSHAASVGVVTTSREPLGLEGEVVWALSPMEPNDAGQLFSLRASSVSRGFAVDADGVETVASICEALDRLPLAIELAAARVTALSPTQILSRLGARLALLTKRGSDATARHRTMRATIEWSYALLEPDQQSILSALSVFRGGCSAASAEAVADATLDELQSLVEKSLVSSSGERFTLLETIREFAEEVLEADAERAPHIHQLHAEHFSAEAPTMGHQARRSDLSALEQLDADHENMNAAFDWAIQAERVDLCELLVEGLWYDWVRRGTVIEGYRRAERAVALSPQPSSRLLTLTGELARFSGRLERSVELKEAAIELGDQTSRLAATHSDLAGALMELGRWNEAEEHARRGLALRTEIGDAYGIAHAQGPLIELALARTEYEQAAAAIEETAQIFRAMGARSDLAWACLNGAMARTRLGQLSAAEVFLREAIEHGMAVGEAAIVVEVLDRAAELAARRGAHELALTLHGAATSGRARMSNPYEPDEAALELSREQVDEGRCLELIAAGEQMGIEAAIEAVMRDLC